MSLSSEFTFEDGLNIANQAMQARFSRELSDIETIILRGALEGQTYEAIADNSAYSISYLRRNVGPKLWKELSEALGETVSKSNFRGALSRYRLAPTETSPVDSLAASPETPQVNANGEATVALPSTQQDWGEAVDVSLFLGRSQELALLHQHVIRDRCQVMAILGMGGMGKTYLAVKFAQLVQDEFEFVIWRSLRNAPSLETLLTDCVAFCSGQTETQGNPQTLLNYLRNHRCLLILDNLEALLTAGDRAGAFNPDYADYGDLLRLLAEVNHQSCLLLTSREKPAEVDEFEGIDFSVRSLNLQGSLEAATLILQAKGLTGSEGEKQDLCDRYSCNPLAIKIVATPIQSLFGGDIGTFLAEDNLLVFNGLQRLIEHHFQRLSALEKTIMFWLAVNREWTSVTELMEDIVPTKSKGDILAALESLSWRSLIETRSGQYTQQPVIMEYVTDRLIQTVCQDLEILGQQTRSTLSDLAVSPLLFCTHALIKATAKDYVRESQRRVILSPVAERLQTKLGQPQIVSQYAMSLLATLRQIVTGYGVGNFINLCRQLKIDLTGYDFSGLTIWQADLLESNLKGTNFAQANFHNCQFSYHFGAVTALALNPDNTLLAAGDLQGNINIWQMDTYQHLCTINAHADGIFAIAFSPDNQHLLTGSSDTTLKLWRICDYECVTTFEGHCQMVMSVAFSPEGKQIASAGFENIIKLWDVSSGQCFQTLEEHTSSVRSLTFSTTENILASASFDHTIKLWNWQQGRCIKTLEGHTQGVWTVNFDPNDHFLVSGSDDQTIRVWDPQTGQCLKVLSSNQPAVWFVAVSPDGKRLASGDNSGLIKLWNLESGLCEKTFHGHTGWLWSLVFAKNGKMLFSCGQDRTVRIWDLQNGYCFKSLSGYTNTVWSLAFSPDGQTLASGTHDGNIRLWNVPRCQCISEILHNSPIFDVSFSPDGQYISSGGDDATVKIWSLENATLHRNLTGHESVVRSVTFHPQSHLLASASADQTIKLWNITNSSCRNTLTGHKGIIWSVAFSHDGAYLTTASFDCSIKLWSVATGDCLQTFKGHSDNIFAIDFSSDDSLIVSTSSDATVKFWSVQTGQCVKTLTGHSSPILVAALSPDKYTFVSASVDGCIKIWDVDSGQCRQTLQAHNHVLWALAFSPNGQVLASGGEGDTIKLWNTQSWQCVDTLRLPGLYEGMNLTGATGLSEAQRMALYALGAVST
ncbi:MAG: NACHT domain-containing protein [Leptolyngbya sp. SIO1D8]|nr:NACHT domain-containing protein [Leptolyngbya sp. SIO1D8]